MHIDRLSIGPIQTNCYVITCPETHQSAVIDPGWNDPAILRAVERRAGQVKLILNTHAHWDHIGGNAALVRATSAPLGIHPEALPMLRSRGGADKWLIPLENSPEPDLLLEPGQVLEVGTLRLEVLYTPGHAPGHVSFYEAAHGVVFDGDVLFNQGIGRTDLPGGSMEVLMHSIREVLFALPDDVRVLSGHGPETTIGDEKRYNPWLT
ncbi:MAG: MBL fold metallo-hydrolase [Anaerolineae bacterium]